MTFFRENGLWLSAIKYRRKKKTPSAREPSKRNPLTSFRFQSLLT